MQNHDENDQNRSGNRPFADVLSAYVSRREAIKGGLAAAASAGFLANADKAQALFGRHRPLMNFAPVTLADAAASDGRMPLISDDYEYAVLTSWGEPIVPSGPAFNYPPNSADQEKQVGIGADGMHFFAARGRGLLGRLKQSNEAGTLVFNCEYGDNTTVFGGASAPASAEDVLTSQHAHGVTVVAIEKIDGRWQVVESDKARRIHVNTPVAFSGPVAGTEYLMNPAGNAPQGTVNNCANGYTPWGTYLTCEENFNGYFSTSETSWTASATDNRYGITASGFGYGWHLYDARFDLANADYANERNRFGWVMEIDPSAPTSTPVKRTALGRFKHEGAAVTVGRGGRAVVYMGDDERFDYVYKFVSKHNWIAAVARGISPLDEGTLYVAKFNEDGTGEWLELSMNNAALAAEFSSDAEILTYARRAADVVGATPMDRPEWGTVAPGGWVYMTMTNNSRRTTANGPNPLAPNPDGHIVRFYDSRDHVGTSFIWDVFLIAAETHGTEESFASPDGLWADPDGRIFIETDGGQADGLNNQLLVADSVTGEIRRLFVGVNGDEITGIAVTPDRKTMFINTQHPGNGDPTVTNFPAPPDGVTVPRDSVIVLTKKDGGVIGS